MAEYEVVVGAGTLRSESIDAVRFPHRWTTGGVTAEVTFTGAHLLHLAVAGCVLNDVYREAAGLTLPIEGVRVCAGGGFDTDTWSSTGITYEIEIDSPAPADPLAELLAVVDGVAEIPRAVRAGAPARRVGAPA